MHARDRRVARADFDGWQRDFGAVGWSYDDVSKHNGTELAGRICSGMVSVNSVFSFALVPSVPFGGVGDSGFGRIHGEDGLREFCYAHTVVRQKFRPPLPLMTFGRTRAVEERLGKIIALVHGTK